VWIARGSFDIYRLRLRLNFGEDLGYYYDETTDPKYRRLGLIGKLLKAVWESQDFRAASVCIASTNTASQAANQNLGFHRFATCRFQKFGFLRNHAIRLESERFYRHSMSLASLRVNNERLVCDIGHSQTNSDCSSRCGDNGRCALDVKLLRELELNLSALTVTGASEAHADA
jgi:hypothetical protein